MRASNRVLSAAASTVSPRMALAPLLGLLMLSACPAASAQGGPPAPADKSIFVQLPPGVPILLQPTADLSSATVRVGDYVKFNVVDDVIVLDGAEKPQIVIPKGTIAFGRVIERHHKFTAVKKGAFRVELVSLRAADHQEIRELRIARPNNNPPCPKATSRVDYKKAPLARGAAATDAVAGESPGTCVAGRVYAGTVFSNLPSAIITAASTAGLVLAKDRTAKAAAAVTLIQQVSSQPGIGNIINGADALIGKDEIFQAFVTKTVTIKMPPPAQPPPKQQ